MSDIRKTLRFILPDPAVEFAKNVEDKVDSVLFRIWENRLKTPPILERPIFMIGCPRSGTSMSANIFAIHPLVAHWSEAGQIWDPDRYFDPDADHCWNGDMVTEEAARRIHKSFEYYRWKKGKNRFLNKHPRNSVRIDYVREIFPDAFFIHVVRDGRPVVNSIMQKIQREPRRQRIPFGDFCKPPNWRKFLRDDPAEQAALQWREIVSYVINKKYKLGDRYFQIRYEDICARPRRSFASLYEFVGLPVSDSILSKIPGKINSMNMKYIAQLSVNQINMINSIQGNLLQKLDYDH